MINGTFNEEAIRQEAYKQGYQDGVREERERIGKTMREVYERRTRQLDAIRGSAERPFAVAGIDLQYNFMQEVLQALTPTNPDKQTEVCEICHGEGNNGADDAQCLNCGGTGVEDKQ